jgi:Zn-dependent peptidase ImmA (M78 family)
VRSDRPSGEQPVLGEALRQRIQLTELGRVAVIYERKRRQHPELGRPLTWRTLQRICTREGIVIDSVAMADDAQLLRFWDEWTILVNVDSPHRRHTYLGAHELAHVWCHVDDADGRGAVVRNYGDYAFGNDDPREEDAECLATMLCQGPRIL